MAGNFRNTTLGLGVLACNGIDVGFLKGTVKLDVKATLLKFLTGVPLQFQGQVITQEEVSLTASVAEINVDNLQLALGRGAKGTNAGTVVSVVNEAAPFIAVPGSHYDQYIVLDGPAVTGFVLHAADGTTVINASNYFLDAAKGLVFRNPAGTITSLEADLKASYSYTPVASEQVNFGASFVLNNIELDFVHTSPVSGSTHQIHFWQCQSSATLSQEYSEGAYQLLNIEFSSLPSAAHPVNPTGYEKITYANGAGPSVAVT